MLSLASSLSAGVPFASWPARVVVGHADDRRYPAAAGRGQRLHDGFEVVLYLREDLLQARDDLVDGRQRQARVEVIRPDVDGYQLHVPPVPGQEGRRLGELRAGRVAADATVDHGAGGLARAAKLDQLERR